MNVILAAALGAVLGAGIALIAAAARSRELRRRHETERRALQDSLSREERSSRTTLEVQDVILSAMQDGVLLIEPDGTTAFANDALERHLGFVPDTSAQLFPVALQGSLERARDRSGTHDSILVELGDPPRSLRAVSSRAGDDGAVLMVIRDVTEARRIDAIRRDFVANASHELKTPAASIQAAAETLRHAAVEDPRAVPRFAGQIEREALRLSRIVEDLLDLSRLESGSELSEHLRFDALVREEAIRYEEAASEADVTLALITPDPAPVRGSPRDLSLMVRNLVDNAIRYTRPGGSVRARVEDASDVVRLTVSDSGVGIPAKDLPRIFERFYRVDRARSRETGGTGLGLAIVKHVAENHGGAVEVVSELGRGTTFVVTLPRDAESDRDETP